ncbi:hypothetical protein [Gelidibacter sediminis]|uniref:hypothetical protein n=1 Tax=Gelidibacter sediminis TaxID=1608710 RepID=UPI00105D7040|nr:hypothetical protein [Gelidibacter sediminis]
MNKVLISLTCFIITSSCIEKHNSNAQKANITPANPQPTAPVKGDTLYFDLQNPAYIGKALKCVAPESMKVKLKYGYVILRDNELVNGTYVANMSSIEVTDIPEHEHVPRNKLNSYLKSPDFF